MSTIEREVVSRAELDDLVKEREAELKELKARLAEWEEAYDETPKRDTTLSRAALAARASVIGVRLSTMASSSAMRASRSAALGDSSTS